ncbi:hypothetical protein TYRP_012991 [Tyrophagus putrescentiae]|nr:hypothetical protein TYRP_012991 [Tyrophagus putrescentiae]
MKLSSSLALALLSVLFYLASASSDESPVSLANLPEKMSEMGKFLQSLQGRLKKSTRASPEIGLIMRRTMLREIEEKREVVDSIDRLIRLLFQSGTMARDDRVELELHLRNCKAFRTLTDDIVQKIKELNHANK